MDENDNPAAERELGCPIFEAGILIAPHDKPTCNGLVAPNMSKVRRHLQKQHLKRKPKNGDPPLNFLAHCLTCNEQFIDETVYRATHNTATCRKSKRPRKGDDAQREQWITLCALIFDTELAQRSYDSKHSPS